MKRGLIILLVFFLNDTCLSAQSISPFTLNIAGFTAQQNGYSLTISTGEAISITNFKSPNGASLNSGFLQNNPPIVTGIEELLSKIGINEVSITPNPTNGITNLIYNFNAPGQMQYQILDMASNTLYRSEALNVVGAKYNKIELATYPAGVYYIQVFYKPNTGSAKSGIYKIIKL